MNKTTNLMALILILLSFQATTVAAAKFDTKIIGELRDGKSNEKIGFANVIVFHAGDSVQVTGTASGLDGSFFIDNLPYGTYDLAIYMMGYEKKKIEKIELKTSKPNVNLGTIALTSTVLSLSEVGVTAERSKLELSLDKKVFTVGKDLANTGSSATDVLNDIPSVTVDIDGNVSLRGSSNVTILVDGKPSGLVGITGTAGSAITVGQLDRKGGGHYQSIGSIRCGRDGWHHQYSSQKRTASRRQWLNRSDNGGSLQSWRSPEPELSQE